MVRYTFFCQLFRVLLIPGVVMMLTGMIGGIGGFLDAIQCLIKISK